MTRLTPLFAWTLLVASEASAWATPPHIGANPAAYAVVIGSNQGEPGQQPLDFAETDARRVRDVLTELGRYAPENVRLLPHPSAEQVLGTLDELKARLDRHRTQGEPATLFFYYSGHARANAMNLGASPLELRALRDKLTSLPTALTVVVLDACQSGAFSRVKGAERAADFSFNSVNSLNTRGLAVMASSTSVELSQESTRLGSSFFTNYLLVALRGAGDENGDGRVSLDEAYKYAYGQTLAATSRTAVGGQHVTLETELTGQGEVAMTYPASSTSQIVLPKDFSGQVLLQNARHHAVLAELAKVPGVEVQLAVPPAEYDAVVRRDGKAWQCKLALGDHQTAVFDLRGCTPIADEAALAKGHAEPVPGEVWGLELGLGLGFGTHDDQYVHRLEAFGYTPTKNPFAKDAPLRWSVGVSRKVVEHFSLIARARLLDARNFNRGQFSSVVDDPGGVNGGADSRTFGFATYGLSIGGRGSVPLVGRTLSAYGELEAGAALATSFYYDANQLPAVDKNEAHVGFLGVASAGLVVMPWRQIGLFTDLSYAYAPALPNLLGDTHDSGGFTYLFGARACTWGTP